MGERHWSDGWMLDDFTSEIEWLRAENDRYREALELIAENSQDKLKSLQARAGSS